MVKKKWLRRKGCKNCALVLVQRHCSQWCEEDCPGHAHEWVVQPYYPDREFVFITKKFDMTTPQIEMKNISINDKGEFVTRKK